MKATKLIWALWASVALFAASLFLSIGFVIGNPHYAAYDFRIDVTYYINPASYVSDSHPFTERATDRSGTHTPFLVPMDQPEALVEAVNGGYAGTVMRDGREYRRVVQAPSGILLTSAFFPILVALSVWLMSAVGLIWVIGWAWETCASLRKPAAAQPTQAVAVSN